MPESKTSDNTPVMNFQPLTVFIVAFIISLIVSNLFLLFFLLGSYSFNLRTFLVGSMVFLISMASILLVKAEFLIEAKKDYKRKPPLVIIMIFVSFYFFFLWLLPESIAGQSKTSPEILLVLIIPNLALTILLHFLYKVMFVTLIAVIEQLRSKALLTESDFLEKLEFKIKEIQRYGGTFSLILITFIVPEFALKELKQTQALSLFYKLVQKSIRDTDSLGVCGNGNIAAVLSNNNNQKKALMQTRRIMDTLKKNSLFRKKIEVYHAEFANALSEYSREILTGADLFDKTVEKIHEEQKRYWNKIAENGKK
ncbi:MAG: hypothetical protein JXJ04_15435 [Spirochaetales bacterium]|nr:hypothetical protein [Spirochaetales bacterium]